MQDNLGLIILVGLCVFGLVFMALGMLLFNSAHHIFRRFFIVGIINKVIGGVKDDVEDEVDERADRPVHHVTRGDIRARAESLDFDAALAKYAGQTAEAQRAERPLSEDSDDDDRPRVIRRRDQMRRQDDDDDED